MTLLLIRHALAGHRHAWEGDDRVRPVDDRGRPLLSGYVRDRKAQNPELWTAYCACIDLLAQFREIHVGYADSYIHRQHQSHESNPTAVGTGGTPFMAYLQKHLDETKRVIDG